MGRGVNEKVYLNHISYMFYYLFLAFMRFCNRVKECHDTGGKMVGTENNTTNTQ